MRRAANSSLVMERSSTAAVAAGLRPFFAADFLVADFLAPVFRAAVFLRLPVAAADFPALRALFLALRWADGVATSPVWPVSDVSFGVSVCSTTVSMAPIEFDHHFAEKILKYHLTNLEDYSLFGLVYKR